MDKEKIILDSDPGEDDAVAILLAVGSPNIDLLGISTVGGNQSIDKVTYNARAVLKQAGREDIPVYQGADRPILRPLQSGAYVHGETGLNGTVVPEPTVPIGDKHGVNWIVETIMSHEPKTITLVPTGPLTNIALALRMEPAIAERVKRVVLMGGGVFEANKTAAAEFNIATDPEAARIVFEAPWDVTMVGLDVTHKALCKPDIQKEIEETCGKTGAFMSGLMDGFRAAYQANQDFVDPPVHDPCTVAYIIDESVLTTRRCNVEVVTQDGPALGETVADMRGPENPDSHTQVALKLDYDKFWAIVKDALLNVEKALA